MIQSTLGVLRLLPPGAKLPLRAAVMTYRGLVKQIQAAFTQVGAKSDVLASAYYLLASGQFRREHRAVLQGKLAYLKTDYLRLVSIARLRRNIHRIEKGLIMRPRRAIFGEEYINETVMDFRRACAGRIDEAEKIWAHDVLLKYFDVVKDSSNISVARAVFRDINSELTESGCIPYPSRERIRSTITFDDLLVLFQARRSTRWFQPRAVSRLLLEKAVFAASLAPSACNRQPFYFIIIDDPVRAAAIARLAGGTAGFSENIQCLIVSVGDLSCYVEERDRHLIYIDASLANMQLMLALETLGLSTCAINWPDIGAGDRAIGRVLGLGGHERVVMLMAVGYADPEGGIPFSQKKTSGILIRWETED